MRRAFMEKVFYTCGDEGLEELNQALSSGGTVKTVTVTGGKDYRTAAEAYIVVDLPPQADNH